MKVTIVTWGSRGDYQPYLALAVEFQRAGHEVRLGATQGPGFSSLASAHGVEFVPLADAANAGVMLDTANSAITTGSPVKAVRLIMNQLMLPRMEQMFGQCLELAQWSDIVVSHFFQIAGKMAAEKTGRAYVSGTLVPTQLPTATRPPGTLPNLGNRVNRFIWKTATAYMNAAWLGPVNEARTRFGLRPLTDVATTGFYSGGLNLVAMSPKVFSRPHDWPSQHQMTGYWLLETPTGWKPPTKVEEFLANGPPPVAVGFGSMTSVDGAGLTRKVLRAVERAGVRAILEPGMAGLGRAELSPDILVADGVPHAWLLPRVAALVHHGGAGTAGAVFHCGVPSVFVPHVFDQHIWAKRAEKLGVAPAVLPIKKLTVKRLATAIERAVNDPRLRERARQLGERLQAENGVAKGVRAVEEAAARMGEATSAVPR